MNLLMQGLLEKVWGKEESCSGKQEFMLQFKTCNCFWNIGKITLTGVSIDLFWMEKSKNRKPSRSEKKKLPMKRKMHLYLLSAFLTMPEIEHISWQFTLYTNGLSLIHFILTKLRPEFIGSQVTEDSSFSTAWVVCRLLFKR